MTVRNGLQSNFYEWSGQGTFSNGAGGGVISTLGSVLVIDPAIDLSLATQYSDMSNGTYACQFNITLYNQSDNVVAPVITLIAVNSGIFICEKGQASFLTGMLTQDMDLDTKSKESITDKQTYENEITGGSIENIGSIHKHLKQRYSHADEHQKHLDDEMGESAGGALSGGAMSAGAISGGEMHQKSKRFHEYAKT